jgi:hypothetical protein
MNTLWLKIAAVAVAVLVLVIVVGNFAGKDKPAPAPAAAPQSSSGDKSVYDQFKEDDKRLNAAGQASTQPQAASQAQTAPAGPNQTVAQAPVQPVRIPKFKSLQEEQQARGEELWNMVLTSRKMGRLPGMAYGDMVRYCRQILRELPGSKYAFQAKGALADIPDRARTNYNVTQQELDTLEFYK